MVAPQTHPARSITLPAEDITEKFRGYTFQINWYSSKPYDPKKEAIDVRITTRDGEEYFANFTTLPFLEYMFEKNAQTGECASGTYFCMPGMIIVRELTAESIKRTIDELIEGHEIGRYFCKPDDE